MFDVTKIKAKVGIVGINQPIDPAYAILDAANYSSASGIFVDDLSPFVKVSYLKETQDYSDASSLQFNAFLKRVQEQAIVETVNDTFNEPDVIESKPEYTCDAEITKAVTNEGDFVGRRLIFDEIANSSLVINKCWLNFNGAGTIKLLLFNQFRKSPIQTKSITLTDTGINEVALNWVIPYSDIILGGRWYIGYLTDGLAVTANNMDRAYNCLNHVEVVSGRVHGWNTETIFEPVDFITESNEFGLNFDFSFKKDVTATIVNNINSLAMAIGYKMAIKCIEVYKSSKRSNGEQRLTEDKIRDLIFEIEGNPELRILGLFGKYRAEISKVRKSLSHTGYSINIGSKI
jgi:hypothetical protein